jgi:hypothetical protein
MSRAERPHGSFATPRVIQLVHELPGRVRLRLPWLRQAPEQARDLADALARLDVSMELELRPWTGSLLCRYDPERLDAERILAAVRRETGVAIVRRPGEHAPELDAGARRAAGARASRFSSAMRESFRGINRSVMRQTEGHLDLGALFALGFLTLGAVEIASTRRLPAPPWFNLAWWSFRTLTIFGAGEAEGDEASEAGADDDAGEVDAGD